MCSSPKTPKRFSLGGAQALLLDVTQVKNEIALLVERFIGRDTANRRAAIQFDFENAEIFVIVFIHLKAPLVLKLCPSARAKSC
jgi:hypothetical protein